ncbi:MAG: RNA-binding protein [Dehalococcoidia bacterium]|nr:RNA-binding protein [Dehalococcoidia bacterium]
MNIYVGNLVYEVTDGELEAAFAPYGQIVSARVISDKFTGRSRGFGFVEMANNPEGEAAIKGLNGKDMKGRPLTVNEARPREERTGGGMGGGMGDGGRKGAGSRW